MFEIKHYITNSGRDLFADWRDKVKDSKAKIAIDRRIYRASLATSATTSHAEKGCGSFVST